jgi:hypothetical protein
MEIHKGYFKRVSRFIKHELPHWCVNGELPPPVAANAVKHVRVPSVHDVPNT